MKVETFQDKFQKRIDHLRELINSHLKNDGDTESTSQRICLINRLNEFQYSVNGVEQSDMKRP